MQLVSNNNNVNQVDMSNNQQAENASTSQANCLTRIFKRCVVATCCSISCAKIMRAVSVLAGVAIPLALFILNPALLGVKAAVGSLTCFIAACVAHKAVKDLNHLDHLRDLKECDITNKYTSSGSDSRTQFKESILNINYHTFSTSNRALPSLPLNDTEYADLVNIQFTGSVEEQERLFTEFKAKFNP